MMELNAMSVTQTQARVTMVWSPFPWYLTSEPALGCRRPRSGPRADAALHGAARGARGAPGGAWGSTGARPRSVPRVRESSSCVLESTPVITVFWDKRLLSGSARPAPYQLKFRFSTSTDPILFASAIPSRARKTRYKTAFQRSFFVQSF